MKRQAASVVLVAASLLPGCLYGPSDYSGGGTGFEGGEGELGGGDLGVTQGGAQDIGFARQVIADGGVPTSDAILVEGLLSEHDLPVSGPACDRLICVRPAVARAPRLSTGQANVTWVQVGMASGLPTPFQRPPIDLVVALDTGGSMSVDMAQVEEAVVDLIEHMNADDNLAILAFGNDIHVVKELGPVGDKAALQESVRAIEADGPSPIIEGMDAAYRLLPDGDDPARLARVMVFACAYPFVDEVEGDFVTTMIDDAAARGVGTSYFGVLLGFDANLAGALGEAHGGSFHFLESLERVEQVFAEDLDMIVTPLAYDLAFSLDLDDGVAVDALFGIPGVEDPDGQTRPGFSVATAFPSRNHGAIVAALSAPDATSSIGGAHLSYQPEPALAGVSDDATDETVLMTSPSDSSGEPAFDGPGVRIAVALVNQAEVMIRACDAWHGGDVDLAKNLAGGLHTYLEGEADALDDDGLKNEAVLVAQLLANMQAGQDE